MRRRSLLPHLSRPERMVRGRNLRLIANFKFENLKLTTKRRINFKFSNFRFQIMYVELHAASAFSFLEGASVPEEMAAVCVEKSLPAMALLDRDGVYGSPRFHYGMKKAGLTAHIGSEITFSPKSHRSTDISDRRLTIAD